MNTLGLNYLKPITSCVEDFYLKIEVQGTVEPTQCPHCASSHLRKHGTSYQRFMDTPAQGMPSILVMNRRRFMCAACGKTFAEPLPDIDERRSMTSRLVRFIEKECLKKTFALVGREIAVDEKTIKNIFDDFRNTNLNGIVFETPRILGIDELKIIGDYRAMITNIEESSIYDLLPSRRKADLLIYFDKMPNKDRIEVVTMDMWQPYKQVVQAKLPGRPIVIDRFHVVRMGNNVIDAVRKEARNSLTSKQRLNLKDERFLLMSRANNLTDFHRERLNNWFQKVPLLREAYLWKELFMQIYERDCKEAALEIMDYLEVGIDQRLHKHFSELLTAMRNWRPEILAWYDFPISNAYTESVNRLAKDMNRMGRGYSFDVIRARLLLDNTARKPTTRIVRSHSKSSELSYVTSATTNQATDERVIEFGPHIPTLCDLLESGHFD